jgi:hypothetical protein
LVTTRSTAAHFAFALRLIAIEGARGVHGAVRVAVACQAGGEVVESGRTFVASLAGKVRLAKARAIRLVADLVHSAHVALTRGTHLLDGIVTMVTLVTSEASEALAAHALARLLVAVQVETAFAVAVARLAIRKAKVPVHTAVTIRSQVAELALARPIARLFRSSVYVALALAAIGPIGEALGALVALGSRVLWFAFALASERRTVARRVRIVTVTLATRQLRVDGHILHAVIAGLALFTVGAHGVVLVLRRPHVTIHLRSYIDIYYYNIHRHM